jgi:hypothetical protein
MPSSTAAARLAVTGNLRLVAKHVGYVSIGSEATSNGVVPMGAFGIRLVAPFAVAIVLGSCNRNAPIYNVSTHNFATPSAPLSVRTDQIKQAGKKLGWAMTEEGPGQIKAKLSVRSHTATVRVNYTPAVYAITYVDSTGLDVSGTDIHKNYNGWVKNLEEGIYKQSGR